MKRMLKARQRIDFAMFTFAQSSGIDDVMIERSRNRFPIEGALDLRQAKPTVGSDATGAECRRPITYPRYSSWARQAASQADGNR